MVEERITDGKRIAELLASELSARETGPLERVEVIDADRDATPSADGTPAYGIAIDGVDVGTASLFPDYVRVTVSLGVDAVVETAASAGVPARREGETAVLRVESGAAVKPAVDVIAAAVEGTHNASSSP
ncbi:hypothetical protein [Halapricum desulfuricans]|uniref:DUF7993 domain-containing protein n=1 Tax=Halapricum desulfuricans TaxID=2841257 RepID=A0A897NCQ3_9EURY|nr:hypothetical protein [Halapricum desulfuricans]QSG10151.1 Uncharacterized protein HSR122_2777 [Halapricum desulfuricans]